MEDEDVHYCLRCRATVHGLENYINHRRDKCHQNGASSKSNSTDRSPPPIHNYLSVQRSGRHSGLTRSFLDIPSKSNRSDPILSSSSNHVEEHLKPRESNETPLVADLSVEMTADDFMNHLGLMVSSSTWPSDIHTEEPLRADDFFSLLELQSCKAADSNRQRTRRSTEAANSGGDQFKPETESEPTDEQQDQSFTLSETADLNASHDSTVMVLVNNDELADTSGLLAGPSHEPDRSSCLGSVANQTRSTDEPHEGATAATAVSEQTIDASVAEPSSSRPVPFLSRGKWMPGLKPRDIHKTGSSVEYHCKACNRRLTGRTVFERHLQSELHFKRTAQQMGLGATQYDLRCKKDKPNDSSAAGGGQEIEDDEGADDPWLINKKKVKGSANARRCPTCSVWVPKPLFGKHLVSRYHYMRSRKRSDREQVILDYIHLIAMEAPFQCRPCRFYFHSHSDLLSHWRSEEHEGRDGADTRRPDRTVFRCSLCGIDERCSKSMGAHLTSEAHRNCVDIVNKSVPVIVSKLESIACHVCLSLGKSPAPAFRYHVQLNRHLQSEHSLAVKGATGHSGRSFTCQYCGYKTASNQSFTHHQFACKAVPKEAIRYRCLICELAFVTREESIRHRSTQEHRDTARRRRSGNPACDTRPRTCPHCYRTFEDLTGLKEHSVAEHPDQLPRCSRCGATFALKQQLSAHSRTDCRAQAATGPAPLPLSCQECLYRCRLKAELLFHQAVEHRAVADGDVLDGKKYRCPECDLIYGSSAALKAHVKSHAAELAFRCQICGRHFAREEERLVHMSRVHAPKSRDPGDTSVGQETRPTSREVGR